MITQPNRSITEVVFKVSATVRFGEDIRVCGNSPALGCNEPARSVPLVTTSSDFPWWFSREDTIRYRYCIFSGGTFNRWEGDGTIYRSLGFSKSDQCLRSTCDVFGNFSNSTGSPAQSPSLMRKSILTTCSDNHALKSRQFAAWSTKATHDSELTSQDGVIVVSYFLPVILSKSADGTWHAKWDEENLLAFNDIDMRSMWVGSVRYQGKPIHCEDEEAVSQCLRAMNCFPVFIDQETHHQFYDIFCKQKLWLLMHHVADVYGPLNLNDLGSKNQQDLWYRYNIVNQLFRTKIVEIYNVKDLIWIHGFHLMLLPSFLRMKIRVAKIGYFFHTPFPSSEIWRTITRREDLLRGILASDQIGFHLYEYARHFLTSCRRLLGYSYEMNTAGQLTVNVDGREVAITCIHVGVDIPRINILLAHESFESQVMHWREKFPNKIIVAGIDRLERLKGIPLKLEAIQQFMTEHPEWQGRLVFSLIGVTAHERGSDYQVTRDGVRLKVDEMNEKFGVGGEVLVHFEERLEQEIGLNRRLAYFAAADILMITPTRDGLNRLPMEFTLAREKAAAFDDVTELRVAKGYGVGLPNQGIVILSEFISSARVMRGAITVNPWRIDEVKKALQDSLEMSALERADRTRRNVEFSQHLNPVEWASHVLYDLKNVAKSEDVNETCTVGFGTGFRVLGVRSGFQSLDTTKVISAYRTAAHRLILLDWGGTLVAENDKVDNLQAFALASGISSRSGPTAALKETLESLCADSRNIVFVVSGKGQDAVQDFFGDVKGLGLAAEHGSYFKWPQGLSPSSSSSTLSPVHNRHGAHKEVWHTTMTSGEQAWKSAAKKIMDIYVQRTHGTYLEQKSNALIWQFRDADPEFGFLQSKELEEHLTEFMSGFGVQVLRGGGLSDGYIEVRPAGVSKGVFLNTALDTMKSHLKSADFILAIGDDNSDEPMFDEIAELLSHESIAAFGVTVGKKPTAASAYVDDPAAVIELLTTLNRLVTHNKDMKRFHSVVDLRSQCYDHSLSVPFQRTTGVATIQSQGPMQSSFAKRISSDGNLARSAAKDDHFEAFMRKSNALQQASPGQRASAFLGAVDLASPAAQTPAKAAGSSISPETSPVQLCASTSLMSWANYKDNIDSAPDSDEYGIFFD